MKTRSMQWNFPIDHLQKLTIHLSLPLFLWPIHSYAEVCDSSLSDPLHF